MRRYARTLCVGVAVWLILAPLSAASAQGGAAAGKVTSGGASVPSVQVSAFSIDSVRAETRSDEGGSYRLPLPPGSYALVFRLPGYAPLRVGGVRIGTTGSTTVDAEMVPLHIELTRVVVSVGRHSEQALDAAAAVSVVDESAIKRRDATSPLDYVMSTPGLDVAVQGLQGRQVVGRGFNGTFGPSLLLMSDYRNAALPSIGASLGYFLTPNADDLSRIEVIRGPASALYGSNAADGVVHFITKSPFDSPGTTLSVTGGDRSLFEGTGRYAAIVSNSLALKVSGTYFRGNEWPSPPQPSEITARDPISERFNSEFRADYRIADNAVTVLTLGTSEALRNVEYTPIGTYQLDHSRADFAQLRLSDGALFAQVYVNTDNSPARSTVNLQTLQTATDHSNVIVGQIQDGFDIGERSNITYGLDVKRTDPQTDGTVDGRNENNDRVVETGIFAYASTRLASWVQLVGAARGDRNSHIDGAVFSPRLALVFTPADNQRIRLSYNRAFSFPTSGNLFLDVVAAKLTPLPYTIRAEGVPADGFQFAQNCGGPCMVSPFAPGRQLPLDGTLLWPAIVQFLQASGIDISGIPAPNGSDVSTVLRSLDIRSGAFTSSGAIVGNLPGLRPTSTSSFEAGYKGLIGQRLVLDASVYTTQRKNFIAPLSVITPNVFLSTTSLAAYLGRYLPAAQAGALAAGIGGIDGNPKAPGIPLATVGPVGPLGGSDILLSYRNVGNVQLWGTDIAADYAASEHYSLSGSYSWVSNNYFPAGGPGEIDISTNSPRSKALLSGRFLNGADDASLELRGRYVGGFHMVDGVWNGYVRPFTVGDIEVGATIPGAPNARLTLTVQNFANTPHEEFFAAPILGRLVLMRIHYRL
ncbi:MAG: TonB-dependent receptor [Gemmatimonadaceae bacterium]